VYVELQDISASVGRSMRLFCNLGDANFRPEHKRGLQCELLDKDGHPVPSAAFAFSGGIPRSEWVTLPSDATVRLRCSPFGVYRTDALAISPHLGKLWVIADDDPREYFLSGSFTVDPAGHLLPPGKGSEIAPADVEHVWRGTIVLPAVRIASARRAATSQPNPPATQPGAAAADDPITRLATTLAPSHGLWLNGAFPKLDLPRDAPEEQVMAQVFQMTTTPQGRITEHRVLEKRQVNIPAAGAKEIRPEDTYTAFHVDTNLGRKIVLLRHSPSGGWWSRVFDVK
jgi:hypothetical protein